MKPIVEPVAAFAWRATFGGANGRSKTTRLRASRSAFTVPVEDSQEDEDAAEPPDAHLDDSHFVPPGFETVRHVTPTGREYSTFRSPRGQTVPADPSSAVGAIQDPRRKTMFRATSMSSSVERCALRLALTVGLVSLNKHSLISEKDNHPKSILYFMHVPKTAGNSFGAMLVNVFESDTVCRRPNFGEDTGCASFILSKDKEIPATWNVTFEAQYQQTQARLGIEFHPFRACDVVWGHHYSYSLVDRVNELLPGRTILPVTMLRDPVERTYSYFYFMRYCAGYLHHGIFSPARGRAYDPRHSLLNLSLLPFIESLANRALSLDNERTLPDLVSLFDGSDSQSWCGQHGKHPPPRSLERAIDNALNFSFIGFVEDIPGSMQLMRHALELTETPALPPKDRDAGGNSCSDYIPDSLDIRTPESDNLLKLVLADDIILYNTLWTNFLARKMEAKL